MLSSLYHTLSSSLFVFVHSALFMSSEICYYLAEWHSSHFPGSLFPPLLILALALRTSSRNWMRPEEGVTYSFHSFPCLLPMREVVYQMDKEHHMTHSNTSHSPVAVNALSLCTVLYVFKLLVENLGSMHIWSLATGMAFAL